MSLNVTGNDAAQRTNEVVDLSWCCTANGICDTNPVYADFVDGAVNGEEVDERRAKTVFAREPDFEALALNKFDYLDCGLFVSVTPLRESMVQV